MTGSGNPEPVLPEDVAAALALVRNRLGPFEGRISWLPETGSTNDVVLACAEAGADEGVVVVAELQTRGRGRLGRRWASPAGAGIYASVLLRPAAPAPLLTLAAGVAIAEGIQAATGLVTMLKWPNDICVPGAAGLGLKLGGILAEAGACQARATARVSGSYAVVGFGINVQPAAYPPEVAARATCIEHELGRTVDRGLVLAECLAAIWQRYDDLRSLRAVSVLEAWRRRARSTFGKPVAWDAGGHVQSGVAEGVDDDGALLVRTTDRVVRIIAGEVRWR